MGITGFAVREVDEKTGSVTYALGGTAPLGLEDISRLLVTELGKCYAAFTAFQALAAEQETYVAKENETMLAAMARTPFTEP